MSEQEQEQGNLEYLLSIIELKLIINELKILTTSLSSEVTSLRNEISVLGGKFSVLSSKVSKESTLNETIQKLIHTQLGAPIPKEESKISKESGTESTPKPKKSNIMEILVVGDCIKISGGKTFDHKDVIKSDAKARWEPDSKSWVIPKKSMKKLVEGLEMAFLEKDKDFVIINKEEEEEEKPVKKSVKKIVKKISVEDSSDEECLF